MPTIIEDLTIPPEANHKFIEDLTVNRDVDQEDENGQDQPDVEDASSSSDEDEDYVPNENHEADVDEASDEDNDNSSLCDEDEEDVEYVPTANQEAVDNQLSDVDEELVQVRANISQLKKSRNPKRPAATDPNHIPLRHAGVDPGFEDLDNNTSKYASLIGGDEEYYGSSDPGSFSSGDSSDDSQKEHVRKRAQRRHVFYDPDTPTVSWQLGLVFQNADEFRDALAKYCVQRGVNVRRKPNESERIRARCKGERCDWQVFASIDKRTNDLVVKRYHPVHNCERSNRNKAMNSKFIAKHYKKTIIRFHMVRIWQIQEMVRDDFTLHVGKTVCRRAKRKIIAEHMGDFKEEFARLYDYRDQLLSTNPGSTCVVKVSRNGEPENLQFQGFYICFKALKDGFRNGCRRCIGVDETFLRGIVKGQLLVAVAKDGNHQMYPLAWVVVSQETTVTWTWFLSILKEDLGINNGDQWTLVSDMQKGLTNAVDELFPEIEHRMCARHILAN
ncbi:hypothetical protein M5689_012420 [Euphorbia peplus]|nr:hypothetical protein M5689_012420 [Euphorbia peplus]